MAHKIIAISRQFGSGGREIGMLVARRLGIKCYDKELIDMAAEHGDLEYKRLHKVDEKTKVRGTQTLFTTETTTWQRENPRPLSSLTLKAR